jgi:serine/threonine-protein kinase RsbW
VKHSEPDSTVDVTIVIGDDTCQLEIGNRGTYPDGTGLDASLPDPLTVGGRGLPFIAALADSATFITGRPGQVLLRIRQRLTPIHSPQS